MVIISLVSSQRALLKVKVDGTDCGYNAIETSDSWIIWFTYRHSEHQIEIQLDVKIAEKPKEVKALLEVGFEYVCQKDNLIFMRKRK